MKTFLGQECQTIIWNHLQDIVKDNNVKKIISKECTTDLTRIQCKPDDSEHQLLSCILGAKDQIQAAECTAMINRLELVAFSDFNTIHVFVQKCGAEVEKYNCGRLADPNHQWSQVSELPVCAVQ